MRWRYDWIIYPTWFGWGLLDRYGDWCEVWAFGPVAVQRWREKC